MLKTRVITAVILLLILLAVVVSGSMPAFLLVLMAFFAAAAWESGRLFRASRPVLAAALWTVAFVAVILLVPASQTWMLLALSVLLWALRFVPALAVGLPRPGTTAGKLVGWAYSLAVLAAFLAIALLYRTSPVYLLSVLVLVWVADIAAYFVGRAIGRRKLAPSISPGKSWEGAIGGCMGVVLIGLGMAALAQQGGVWVDTFSARVENQWGWVVLAVVLVLISAASVVGDLFESMLKRRAEMKDSSNLLPGHGGVLDRVDALIPVLPLAALLGGY